MSDAKNQNEPSPKSLEEIPEVDFAGGIRPNRYANLRGAFEHAVFLDSELWRHFGSEERVLEALRLLVELATRETKSLA
jgi:hypothetical protein